MKEYRIRNRYFSAILYEEDVNFKKYKDYIIKHYFEVTYIKHDRDITEDGEIKKEHYHFLFKVGENARTLKSIAKEIGIAENYLQGCNKKPMLEYLIHMNNPEKTQYKIEEVQRRTKRRTRRNNRK